MFLIIDSGRWEMALHTLCCQSEETIDSFCTVSTNFSVAQRYSKNGEAETYQQPLLSFQLKTKSTSPKTYNRVSDPIWVDINRVSDILFLKFSDAFTNEEMKKDCEVATILLFRKRNE